MATFAVGSSATRGATLMAQSGQMHFMADNSYKISTPGGSMRYDQWMFFGASIQHASAASFLQINDGVTVGTPSMGTTTTASGNLSIGSNISRNFSMGAGSRIGGVLGWSRPISQAEMLAVYRATKGRFT
jgi:hypothetical protein